MGDLSLHKATFDHTWTNGKGGFKTYAKKTRGPIQHKFRYKKCDWNMKITFKIGNILLCNKPTEFNKSSCTYIYVWPTQFMRVSFWAVNSYKFSSKNRNYFAPSDTIFVQDLNVTHYEWWLSIATYTQIKNISTVHDFNLFIEGSYIRYKLWLCI
jgi:hypothetical protein